mmetsp:Transcript_108060/g.306398  ORF Transcript_108060/g.306398 Transcript_108060/m.306398 type:complete len:359 (+) Transcript_108060:983-2059(+)
MGTGKPRGRHLLGPVQPREGVGAGGSSSDSGRQRQRVRQPEQAARQLLEPEQHRPVARPRRAGGTQAETAPERRCRRVQRPRGRRQVGQRHGPAPGAPRRGRRLPQPPRRPSQLQGCGPLRHVGEGRSVPRREGEPTRGPGGLPLRRLPDVEARLHHHHERGGRPRHQLHQPPRGHADVLLQAQQRQPPRPGLLLQLGAGAPGDAGQAQLPGRRRPGQAPGRRWLPASAAEEAREPGRHRVRGSADEHSVRGARDLQGGGAQTSVSSPKELALVPGGDDGENAAHRPHQLQGRRGHARVPRLVPGRRGRARPEDQERPSAVHGVFGGGGLELELGRPLGRPPRGLRRGRLRRPSRQRG